jgi:hypothetical protein
METPLSRDQLLRREGRVIRQGTYFKPEIRVVDVDSGPVVVKDSAAMHPFLKRLMGRRNQRREVKVYQRLDGVAGVPRLLGVIDAEAFLIELIEGETLRRAMAPERLEKALDDLKKVIDAIHARRVVHLDLKQKRNVVVKPDHTVAVLDFQSAICFGSGWLSRVLFSALKRRDGAGLIKFRGRYLPDSLTPAERKRYDREQRLAKLWPFTHLTRALRKLFRSETNDKD